MVICYADGWGEGIGDGVVGRGGAGDWGLRREREKNDVRFEK